MKKYIPCSSSRRRKKKHRWMNNQALRLHGQKHRAWQQAQVTKHPTDIARARRLAKALQCLTRELRSNFEKDLAKNVKTDPKAFWRYASDNLKIRKWLPDLKKTDGTFTSTDEEKAEILNAFFETTFTEEDTSSIPQLEGRQSAGCLSALDITPEDVHRKLDLLSKFKSARPDGIHPCILRETAPSVCTPLAIIYTKSFKEGKLPSAWKASHVVPVHKKGNKSEATNYRPISLTSGTL
nr:uncharacterized protein LOC129271371 [Lytechinus pictus]